MRPTIEAIEERVYAHGGIGVNDSMCLIEEVRALRSENAKLHAELAEAKRLRDEALVAFRSREDEIERAQKSEAALRAENAAMMPDVKLGVVPCTFHDLHHPVRVSIVDEIAEVPGALGYQITTDDEHRVDMRRGQPRLGTITTLIHEMLHVAEAASGYAVPHRFISMGSVGVVLALARCGVLGANDDEIRAFVNYMKTCESVDGDESDETHEAVDPIEECERLRAELDRLLDVMPSESEIESIDECIERMRDGSNGGDSVSEEAVAWRDRFDAAMRQEDGR